MEDRLYTKKEVQELIANTNQEWADAIYGIADHIMKSGLAMKETVRRAKDVQ